MDSLMEVEVAMKRDSNINRYVIKTFLCKYKNMHVKILLDFWKSTEAWAPSVSWLSCSDDRSSKNPDLSASLCPRAQILTHFFCISFSFLFHFIYSLLVDLNWPLGFKCNLCSDSIQFLFSSPRSFRILYLSVFLVSPLGCLRDTQTQQPTLDSGSFCLNLLYSQASQCQLDLFDSSHQIWMSSCLLGSPVLSYIYIECNHVLVTPQLLCWT